MSTQKFTTVEISKDGTRTTTTTEVRSQNYSPCGSGSFQQNSWTKTYSYGSSSGTPSSCQIQSQSFPCNKTITNVVPTPVPVKDNSSIKTTNNSSGKQENFDDFENECLSKHNLYRKKHRVPELKLDRALCKYADEWAKKLAREDSFRHRGDHKYGENIYMMWSSNSNKQINGGEAVESWYSEVKDYRGQYSSGTGHFSQVVWKDSKMLGVGVGRSKSGKVIVVANYDPAGNMMGRFQENVFL